MNLWPEDMPPGSVVLLSGNDDLVHADEVRLMLEQSGSHIKVCMGRMGCMGCMGRMGHACSAMHACNAHPCMHAANGRARSRRACMQRARSRSEAPHAGC